MNDFQNFSFILIIFSICYLICEKLFFPQKEHFLGPIVKPLKALGEFVTEFPVIFGILVDALINFAINFIDIILSLVNALMWIINIPMWVIMGALFILTAIIDLFTLAILWLNPITMIKGIVKLIFFIVKMIIMLFINTIRGVLTIVSEKILDTIRGGLWGMPHGPEQHMEHSTHGNWAGKIHRKHYGLYGHHHKHRDSPQFDLDENGKQLPVYLPFRCYRGIGANGYLNIIAMILCPPLGVFMSYGIKGIIKIIICAALTLFYYFPGLIYALLITTHLGIGRDINSSDCGGGFGGLIVQGCPKRRTEQDCNEAVLPNKKDKNGEPMKACFWDQTKNLCHNIHFRDVKYDKLHAGALDPNDIDEEDRFNIYGRVERELWGYPFNYKDLEGNKRIKYKSKRNRNRMGKI